MVKRLGLPAFLAVGLLVLTGAGGGSYDDGTYASRGGYVGGSPGAVTWDTVTVVYVFDSTPAGGKHANSSFAADSTAAVNSGGGIYELSDPANEFAFCMVDSGAPNSTVSTVDAQAWLRCGPESGTKAAAANRWEMDLANRRHELFYIPFENSIPANSQIVSADVRRIATTTLYFSNADSVCATLMTSSADGLWHTSVGVTAPSTGMTRYAHATWRYQIAGLNTAGYPASNGGAWVPELNDRDWFWDYGAYSDVSGWPTGTSMLQFAEHDISIANCVQATVRGAVNNGICLSYHDWNTATNTATWYSWEATGAGTPYTTYVVVKYLTRSYRSPWPGGADCAVAIQTDDGRYQINTLLIDTLSARGGKYTAFVVSNQPNQDGVTDPTYIGWTDLLDACLTGVVEIGSHSYYSFEADGDLSPPDIGGLGHYNRLGTLAASSLSEFTAGMYPTLPSASATLLDSLYFDADPDWMNHHATAAGYPQLVGAANFAQSFGVPVCNPGPEALKAFAVLGYRGVRVLAVAKGALSAEGYRDPYTVMDDRPAESDTCYPGLRPNYRQRPRPLRTIANSHGVDDFVGNKAADPSEGLVKYRMRNAIETARASGRRYIAFLIHDVKTLEDGPSYGTGLDPDELGWICDVIDETGARYMTIAEVGDWLAGKASIADQPANLGGTSDFTAADGYWGILDGIDGAFVPGLR